MAIELTDIASIGSILIFLALTGYVAGDFFYEGYFGKTYRPRGGDFERFLHYSSIGITLIILVSLLFIVSFYRIIPILINPIFPNVTIPELAASLFIYIEFL